MKLLKVIVMVIVLIGMLTVIGQAEEKIKVAFIFGTPHNDGGFAQAHDEGRIYLENTLPYVETTYSESIPEDANSEKVMREYCRQGYKVIFTCGFGYMDPTFNVAKDYPDVIFEHCSGYKTLPNMSNYMGRIYEPEYLGGLVAGMMTKSNYIGYVAAFPISNVIRNINGLTIGVREVNPKAEVHVIFLNSWFDPVGEATAARTLIANGADVIAIHADDPSAMREAEKSNVYGIGFGRDMSIVAPKAVLVSAIWNWGDYYVSVLEKVHNNTWETSSFYEGLADGIVGITPYSSRVPQNVRDYVDKRKQEILDGKFEVFGGPIYDREGNLRIKDGTVATVDDINKMVWFVDGVIGALK